MPWKECSVMDERLRFIDDDETRWINPVLIRFPADAAARAVSPSATLATTRSRRSRDYARAIAAGLRPARSMKHCSRSQRIPRNSINAGMTLVGGE